MNTNRQTSTRLVPSGLDIWAEWINGKPIITEVRKGFSADKAGVKNGMEILSINGIPIEQAVNNRIGKCITKIDTEVRNYALRQLLAGTYLVQRVIEIKQNGKQQLATLTRSMVILPTITNLVHCLNLRPLTKPLGISNSIIPWEKMLLFQSLTVP